MLLSVEGRVLGQFSGYRTDLMVKLEPKPGSL